VAIAPEPLYLRGFPAGQLWNADDSVISATTTESPLGGTARRNDIVGKLTLFHKLFTGAPGVSAARARTL